ncbi:hypothetical protein C0993_009436 [Termitomyces sp. T159_Od127]|nr:hypothetical protein C0993_009436 [Termitomyces sp. T159_Od127]
MQVWTVSLPLVILNSPAVSDTRNGGSNPSFGTSRDIAGIVLWVLGFVIEAVADQQKFDELALFDHGSGGLRELKHSIEDQEQVHIGFYREENALEPGFVVINYIPTSTAAVKKVDDLSQLTPEAIHSALIHEKVPDSPSTISTFATGRTVVSPPHPRPKPSDSPLSTKNKDLPDPSSFSGFVIEPVRRATSEPQPQPQSSIIAPPMAKSASMFTSLLRGRKKKPDSVDDAEGQALSEGYIHDTPPPAPPKDKGKFFAMQTPDEITSRQVLAPLRRPALGNDGPYQISQRSRTGSLSEYAVVSHASSSNVHDYGQLDEFGQPQNQSVYLGHSNAHARNFDPPVHAMSMPAGLRGKWGSEPMDAVERLRRRQEELRIRQEEEKVARWEEERMKEERRQRKEQELREIEEAEARRRASIEEEVRILAAERRRKEMLEKEEEERKRREIEERRRLDRERRMEEHRRLEEWRKEQTRMAEESARRTEEARRREERERKKKIQVAEAKVKKNHNVDALISGWVSMQTDDSLLWKRRFYKFIGTAMYFYRSPKDTQQYLDKVDLRGTIRGLREWSEGYEDLEAIPHSFAIEFKDERGHWSMFSDSEEEKYKLLGLLHYAAGL